MAIFSARRAGLLLVLLSLAACSPPVAIVNRSPQGIALRWYRGDATRAMVQEIAARHCRASGTLARLDSLDVNGSIQIARYRCL